MNHSPAITQHSTHHESSLAMLNIIAFAKAEKWCFFSPTLQKAEVARLQSGNHEGTARTRTHTNGIDLVQRTLDSEGKFTPRYPSTRQYTRNIQLT